MQKNSNRMERIEEEIKREISQIIMHDVKNPNITGLISVTDAKVTPDLKYAKIFISILDEKSREQTMEALKKSAGFVRTELARRMNLRLTPEIVFTLDTSIEYGAKMDQLIKKVMETEEKKEQE